MDPILTTKHFISKVFLVYYYIQLKFLAHNQLAFS
jgi:hypothetical protein